MTVRFYTSSDAGSPTLTGAADSINNVLLACLVNGYGSKVGAGWTSPFYDAITKTRVFKSASAPFAFLQSQDNGQSTAGLREARVRGYESMTAFDTGTGLYPTAAQRGTGMDIRKSLTIDATVRAWTIVADEKRFYLFTETGDVANNASAVFFGDIKSYKLADNYPGLLAARYAENYGGLDANGEGLPIRLHVPSNAPTSGYCARSYTGVGSAVAVGFTTDTAKTNATAQFISGNTGFPYPHAVDGGLYLAKTFVHESQSALRGELPGLWTPLHNKPLAHRDTFSGVEGLVGRSFIAINIGAVGQAFIETSNTWDL